MWIEIWPQKNHTQMKNIYQSFYALWDSIRISYGWKYSHYKSWNIPRKYCNIATFCFEYFSSFQCTNTYCFPFFFFFCFFLNDVLNVSHLLFWWQLLYTPRPNVRFRPHPTLVCWNREVPLRHSKLSLDVFGHDIKSCRASVLPLSHCEMTFI